MNDNDDDEKELRAIIDGTNSVLAIVREIEPHVAMQVLASVTSCLLCSGLSSERDAYVELESFRAAIIMSMRRAKQMNMTLWVEGKPH